jgi:hypothetical protein
MQEFVVFLIVGAAFAYVARTLWLSWRGDKSCGGCNGCASNKNSSQAPREAPLVQIDLGGSWNGKNSR